MKIRDKSVFIVTETTGETGSHVLPDSSRCLLREEVLPPGAGFLQSDQHLRLPRPGQSAGQREGGGGHQETISNQDSSRDRETPLGEEFAEY